MHSKSAVYEKPSGICLIRASFKGVSLQSITDECQTSFRFAKYFLGRQRMAFQHRVSFVTLASSNLNRLVKFYQYLFGFSPTLYTPQKYAEFQLPCLRLVIFQPQLDNISEFVASSSGKMSICFEVENLEDAMKAIETAYTSLSIASGDRPIMGKVMAPSHGREIYAYDIDGNRLILHEANS